MTKPLFRWTVGPCLPQGLEILIESVHRTTSAFGVDNWDWCICYNGLNKDEVGFIQRAAEGLPITLYSQDWATCPVNDNMQTPRRRDGSFEWNGNRCGGTMWKSCPPRLRMESHEIVMDNDIVMLKKFPQIDDWLKYDDKALILEEPIRFYGRYDSLFPDNPPFLNSGFMGFPPGYDFGAAVFKAWTDNGRLMNISQADEQGLLVYTLSRLPSVRIRADQMIEILGRDYNHKVTGGEYGIHFTQANRMPSHRAWIQYKQLTTVV